MLSLYSVDICLQILFIAYKIKTMRIALITLAAPWQDGTPGLIWNRHQPNGINEIGHHAEVFVMSPSFPRFLERFRPTLRKFNDRPHRYDFQGVRFNAIKGWVAHPVLMNTKVSPKFPRLAGRLICWNVERKLLQALREYKPDALLVHDTILNGALAVRLSKKLGIPFGTIDHDPITCRPIRPWAGISSASATPPASSSMSA